jgi:hypothetical protein
MHQSAPTSLTAFKKLNETKKRISDKDMIYAFLLNKEPMTRRELCDALNERDKSFICYDKILYETVVGRCNDLINEGFISVIGHRNNREILKANIEPIPYIPPFKWTDELAIQFTRKFINLDEKYLMNKLIEFKNKR